MPCGTPRFVGAMWGLPLESFVLICLYDHIGAVACTAYCASYLVHGGEISA